MINTVQEVRQRKMYKIAIITARSGSKGLRDKNIKDLCGKPMMAYSIEAAVETGEFGQIIVSTDSEKYGRIAREYGAEVMYRGAELSNDTASSYDVIKDVLERLDCFCDYFALLQPTSPMRNAVHLKEAIDDFESNFSDFDFLVSVKEAEHAGVLVKPIENDMSLKHFDADFGNYRRQSFKEYSPNGAIFMGKPEAYLKRKHFFGARSRAYFMSDIDSVDIDHELDYKLAQVVMTERLKGMV